MYQQIEIFWKYIENKANWKVQWGMGAFKEVQESVQKGVSENVWSFRGTHLIMSVKIGEFDPKIVKNIFEIICILNAAKNYTSNFSDTFFGSHYGISSKASLMAPSN